MIETEVIRTRTPRNGEVLGLVIAMLGAGKLSVECDDGFTRICRIPGKIVKRVWIRVGDLILIRPWKVQEKERADVIWVYRRTEVSWLNKKGYIKKLVVE